MITPPAFEHFPEQWHLSPALDTGEFVFFSGVTGCRPDGSVASNPAQQFSDTFRFLGDTLAAAGLSFEDIVEMTSYHVELRKHLQAFVEAKDSHIRAPYPAWSAIGTTELITEGTLVEIRVICRRADAP
jgi:enamine deaminase RidA (YjgF/YER057c/UK114 family)